MTFLRQVEEQPRRLRELVATLARATHPLRSKAFAKLAAGRPVLFTGMGSSLYACYPAHLRLAAACWETAELIHFGGAAIGEETLVVAVSQSGETAEILALLDRLPPRQPLVAVTNVPESTLGCRAQVTLFLEAERSQHASSQTYVNSVALLLALARVVEQQPLDPLLEAAVAAADSLDDLLTRSFQNSDVTVDPASHLVFLARGPSLAAAQQAALMFHEVAVRGAAAMSAPAFRHGPLEMAGPRLHAVVFEPYGPTTPLVEDLAVELEGFGARVTRIADERYERGDFRHQPVEEDLAPLVNIAPAQAIAHRAAEQQGRDPGVFHQIQPVTRRL
jgi:glucosamine--fructose-6-phosphate aminotransferase (isomerizing)